MSSAPQPGTRFSSLFLGLLLSIFVAATVRAVPIIPSDFQLRFAQLGSQGALGSYALRLGSTSMPMRYGPLLAGNEQYTTEACVFTCLALGYRYAGLHQANNNCGCDDDLGSATQYGRAPSVAFGFALYDTAPLTGWYPLMGYFSISNVSQKFRYSPEDRGLSLHTCNAACIAAGYKYFALQNWQSQDLSQCWCDSSLPDPSDRVSISMTALEADPQRFSTYYLGAPDQLTVYETCFSCLPTVATTGGVPQDPTVSVAPAVPQDVLPYKSIGPYKKSFSVVVGSYGWSPAACNQYCVGQGFSHFALGDYLPSRQSRCYCGSDLSTMTKSGPAYCGVRQPAWQWYGSAGCNFVYETCYSCASSATNAMLRPADTVPYTFLGTFSDRADRALRYGPQEYGYTVDSCNDICSLLGYSYFALQDYSPTMLSWCSCDSDLNYAQQYGAQNCAATSTTSTAPVWNYLRPYYGGAGCNSLYSTKPLIQKAIGAGSLIPWYTASNSRSFLGTPVPETQRYRSVGQFIDRLPRALPYGPHAYGYNAHSCNAACLTQGYSYFALQAYHYWDPATSAGQSWCSCTSDLPSARKYGPATASTVKILNFGAWQALGGWGWNSIYETCSKENCSSPPTATPVGRSKFPAVLAGAGGDFGALGYGTRGWKLGGYLHYPNRVQLRSGDSVEVASWTGNAWTPWLDPYDSRLLIPPAPGGERRGDGWFTNDPMEITVTGAPSAASTEPQCLKVTFYLLDFDSTARRLSIERSYDGQPYEALYTTANDFYNGQYVSVLQPAGKTSKYRLRRVAGANIVCSGILLDDCACSEGAGMMQASKPTRSTGLIIGIVAGVVGILLLAAVVAFIAIRSSRSTQSGERSVVQEPTSSQLQNTRHAESAPATNAAAATAVVAGEVAMTQMAEGRPVVGIPLGYPYPADVEPVGQYDRGDPNFWYASRAPQLVPWVATIRAAPTPALLLELLGRHYPVHPAIEKAFLKEAVDGYVFMECDWPLQIRSLPIDLRPPELQIQKWERFRAQLLQARGGAA